MEGTEPSLNFVLKGTLIKIFKLLFQIGLIDPGNFKTLSEQLSEQTKGKAKLEVLNLKEVTDAGLDETS